MQPLTPQQLGAQTSALIAECLDLAEQAQLTVRDLAVLCGASPATLYRWRKEINEGRLADPEGAAPAITFMNLLIFRQQVKAALADGTVPRDGKKGAKAWVRQLAPDAFDTDAS